MIILVTGDAGFIGRHLCRELRDHGHIVYGADLVYGDDLRERSTVDRVLNMHPQFVIHLAARVGRLFGEDDVAVTVADNAGMTAQLAQACGERGIRLAYASTSEVYGDQGEGWCTESGELRLPHNIYGLSKRWGEEACQLYTDDPILLRLSMPFGPGLPPGRGRAAIVNMLWQAQHRMPIPVHRGAERCWCWIGDTVRGVRLIVEHGAGGPWNVGRSDNPSSMLDVAHLACSLAGASPRLIEEIDPPPRQTVVKRLNNRRLRSLGWTPEVELAEGMERMQGWVAEFDEHARREPK